MKLRIQGNSLRLRLKENEVRQFNEAGQLLDEICFGLGQKLSFKLLKSEQHTQLTASFTDHTIYVHIPLPMAENWAQTELIGLENYQKLPKGDQLKILIEKDFPCTHKTEEKKPFI